MKIAGSRVHDGEIDSHLKYRLMRDGECLIEDLTIHQLKKFKMDVTKVEKGMECGISLNGLKNGIELEEGDVLECYREIKSDDDKFSMKPGLI